MDHEQLELTNEQSERNDTIYDSVFELCCVLADDDDLEWDMEFIGEIADCAAEILTWCGIKVRFPSIVTEPDGSQHIEEFYAS